MATLDKPNKYKSSELPRFATMAWIKSQVARHTAQTSTCRREQLARPEGARARQQLAARGLSAGTIDALGLGYAPPSREALKARLQRQGFDPRLILASGLVVARDDGPAVDRVRNRLTIPIARESGTVVAFGGRAMEADQGPKYLNSPETPIYSKSRTLYGLHLTRADVRRAGMAVLVEGYFDFAQAWQAGIAPVVATCGTALTASQAQVLRRFASRVVISYDADQGTSASKAENSTILIRVDLDNMVPPIRYQADRLHVQEACGDGLLDNIDKIYHKISRVTLKDCEQHEHPLPAFRGIEILRKP